MERLKVGVVFGGRSVEHDVSVITAHQAMAALSARHDVVPIYVTTAGRWLTGEGLNDLDVYKKARFEEVGEEAYIPPTAGFGGLIVPGGRLRGSRKIDLDVVVPAIHGTFGEDGTLQGLLDLASIPYAGSGVAASAAGMDKVLMKAAFADEGLPIVPHHLVEVGALRSSASSAISQIEDAIGYPAFVKPSRLGSSVGIGRADDRDGLQQALEVAAAYDNRILVEKAMDGCIEINCSVLGGPGAEPRASVCEQPVAWEQFLSFQDKYMRSDKGGGKEGMASLRRKIPAPISEELTARVQTNAIGAFKAIDARGVARIDSFVNEQTGETWVMEINTTPGSFSFYLWEESGLAFPDLMDSLLQIAMSAAEERSKLMFSFESGLLAGANAGTSGSKTDG
ncbi:MAG: D-alanine--D-alanine ligase family protein [Actinomycetota bacterium]